MKHLTEQINNIFEENNFNDENIKNKILKFIEEFPQIINESNLYDDFCEGLEERLERKLTEDELNEISSSGVIDELEDEMLGVIADKIIEYSEDME